jgi:major vault protein
MGETNQKDLVLSINEYAYVLDETKGHVSCLVGPTKMSLSQSDKLVNFNSTTKAFEPCSYNAAKHLFVTAPENWYVILKNPVENNKHPMVGTSNTLPDNIHIGEKINIRGPVSFALYPGQMAKVVRGHALRSNQYLLARVYEAESANSSQGEALDPEGKKIETKSNYVNGQILVIKGTEVSFYIPPTGIEVIQIRDSSEKGYVREAVTLERLEYCILKDEDGNKRYVHGPEVVFPEPTETFVTSPKGGLIFRAIELSKISGIYVKVIAEYKDEDGTVHPVGEELFITGESQMIYYPRPEHAIISYDNKIMHHAIAIPEGEGRYVMNRMTGEITTVKGPAMFLPDPRTQVIVKRKLTRKECELFYPGNREALEYNVGLTEKAVERGLKAVDLDSVSYLASSSFSSSLANLEAKANISRGTSYTKPRTITLDNKYDGVVNIDVWTGYAVNVVSKDGSREVICGPQSILLDYDQTLAEIHMSTGKPKTTDNLIKTVFLRHENNKISDIVEIETKDFVKAKVKVSYCVDFDPKYMDKWFNVENYVKYLCDRERSLIKRAAKGYSIEEFYQNYSKIVRDVAIDYNEKKTTSSESTDKHIGRFFKENGMYVYDAEILNIEIEHDVAELLNDRQFENVRQNMRMADAEKRVAIAEKLAEAEKAEQEIRSQQLLNKMALQREEALQKIAIQAEVNRKNEAEKLAAQQATNDLQPLLDAVNDAEIERLKKDRLAEIEHKKNLADIEKSKQMAYAEAVVKTLNAVQPGLIEALNAKANAQMLTSVSDGLAPYAMAKDESVADFINTLLRGTTLENVLTNITSSKE